jgi:hypothetical protein
MQNLRLVLPRPALVASALLVLVTLAGCDKKPSTPPTPQTTENKVSPDS